jgi:hypothetical protein
MFPDSLFDDCQRCPTRNLNTTPLTLLHVHAHLVPPPTSQFFFSLSIFVGGSRKNVTLKKGGTENETKIFTAEGNTQEQGKEKKEGRRVSVIKF